MRGEPNTFRDNWISHPVATPAGELTYTVFPGSERFIGCTKHTTTAYIGNGTLSVTPRRPM